MVASFHSRHHNPARCGLSRSLPCHLATRLAMSAKPRCHMASTTEGARDQTRASTMVMSATSPTYPTDTRKVGSSHHLGVALLTRFLTAHQLPARTFRTPPPSLLRCRTSRPIARRTTNIVDGTTSLTAKGQLGTPEVYFRTALAREKETKRPCSSGRQDRDSIGTAEAEGTWRVVVAG